MSADFEQMLQKYADVVVKVGLNLQPGQRLVIANFADLGVPLQAAPLVRQIASAAYAAGARFVDVQWGDDQLQLIRFQQAPRDSFAEYPAWQASEALAYTQRGDALLIIYTNDPDLLNGQDPELVATLLQATNRQLEPLLAHFAGNAMNWSVISAAHPGWAAKLFPDHTPTEQMDKLWAAIFAACRVDQPDPSQAWQTHADQLAVRADALNRKRYTALHYRAPGTGLTIGLPAAHLWRGSARFQSQAGIPFTPNLPTEEVFTLPHKDQAEGVVKASLPLSHGGALIEEFSLTFAAGRVVQVTAEKGEAVLRKLVESDEGAGHLGEVALVPHSSPIAQSGLLFYNTLFDENAASHIALGQGIKGSLVDGEAMADAEFAAAGGNQSMIHVDFMIGSGEMDVDGVTSTGATEPIMRHGEWAFSV
jgi:aminopeptidase